MCAGELRWEGSFAGVSSGNSDVGRQVALVPALRAWRGDAQGGWGGGHRGCPGGRGRGASPFAPRPTTGPGRGGQQQRIWEGLASRQGAPVQTGRCQEPGIRSPTWEVFWLGGSGEKGDNKVETCERKDGVPGTLRALLAWSPPGALAAVTPV